MLERKLRRLARAHLVDYIGIADLTPACEFIVRQGGASLARFPRAVTLGIALPHAIVDELPRRAERSVAVNYRTHAYEYVSRRLDLAASQVSSLLQASGHPSLPIPAAERCDDERICAVFSHKLAARMAGLGWIGKSCLLVTPDNGPRVRWTTVLTPAPLLPTGSPLESRCGTCTECADACPVHAFSGTPFRESDPRETRFDARMCDDYFTSMKNRNEPAVCGMCLYACPWGREKRIRR